MMIYTTSLAKANRVRQAKLAASVGDEERVLHLTGVPAVAAGIVRDFLVGKTVEGATWVGRSDAEIEIHQSWERYRSSHT